MLSAVCFIHHFLSSKENHVGATRRFELIPMWKLWKEEDPTPSVCLCTPFAHAHSPSPSLSTAPRTPSGDPSSRALPHGPQLRRALWSRTPRRPLLTEAAGATRAAVCYVFSFLSVLFFIEDSNRLKQTSVWPSADPSLSFTTEYIGGLWIKQTACLERITPLVLGSLPEYHGAHHPAPRRLPARTRAHPLAC